MNYTDWNQLIGKYFFNESMAEKEVFLFMSKEDLIKLGKPFFNADDYDHDNYILRDFISASKSGIPGATGGFLEKADFAHQRNRYPIEGLKDYEIRYPLYLSYLVLLVMPLTETIDETLNANNYYSRFNTFIGVANNQHEVNSLNYSHNNIMRLWNSLEYWANEEMGGALGYFYHRKFSHAHWVNVGSMFSQCVLPPKTFRSFPAFFSKYDFVPHCDYSPTFFKDKLVNGGIDFLNLPAYVKNLFRNQGKSELVDKILEIAQREYLNWEGNLSSHDTAIKDFENSTTARVHLQIKYSQFSESLSFSYRIAYKNDYPEDLVLNGQEVYEEMNTFSNTLSGDFVEEFTLEDRFNKWKAVFQKKDIRLFINGSYFQLDNSNWIETDNLSIVNPMLIMCTLEKKDIVEKWLKEECSESSFEINDYDGIPEGYCIYRFCGVRNSLESERGVILKKDKKISLVSELKLDYRTFMRVILPEVMIENADGSEEVFLEYKNSQESVFLTRIEGTNKWFLPEDILLNEEFKIKISGQDLIQNYTNYKIVSADDTALNVFEEHSPIRNKFGAVTTSEVDCYLKGNQIGGVDFGKQHGYKNVFKSINVRKSVNIYEPVYEHRDGNVLLSFLTLRIQTKAKDFFDAFEFLTAKKVNEKQNGKFSNLTWAKKSALNFYDYLGFIDYDYYSDKIVINPPQFIYIPSEEGRTVLLIGARDNSLIKKLISLATKLNLQVEITPQDAGNAHFLLPDRIVIHAFEDYNDKYGEEALKTLAHKLNIKFNDERLHQIGLYLLCGSVSEYEEYMKANSNTDDDFESASKYIFNTDDLMLKKLENQEFDKNLSLIEYKFREWERFQILWLEGKCYDIDRNWGRFVVLKHLQKNIVIYDYQKKLVAIPVTTPLPRLLFESITLMSGFAPISVNINNNKYYLFENIESIYIKNMMRKIGQQVIEQEINC